MDPIDILFNQNKPFTPIVISGGTTGGRIRDAPTPVAPQRLDSNDMEMFQNDVATKRDQLNRNMIKARASLVSGGFEFGENNENDIYKKYKFDRRSQEATQLPVYASKDKILGKIEEYPSVVIEGSTGCGKSTQVSAPRFARQY